MARTKTNTQTDTITRTTSWRNQIHIFIPTLSYLSFATMSFTQKGKKFMVGTNKNFRFRMKKRKGRVTGTRHFSAFVANNLRTLTLMQFSSVIFTNYGFQIFNHFTTCTCVINTWISNTYFEQKQNVSEKTQS